LPTYLCLLLICFCIILLGRRMRGSGVLERVGCAKVNRLWQIALERRWRLKTCMFQRPGDVCSRWITPPRWLIRHRRISIPGMRMRDFRDMIGWKRRLCFISRRRRQRMRRWQMRRGARGCCGRLSCGRWYCA